MFKSVRPYLIGAVIASGIASVAQAADPYIPPPYIPPEPPVYEEVDHFSGWYIRGDIDYHWSKLGRAHYITYGPPPGTNEFVWTDLRGTWSIGAGAGYQISRYHRADLTFDYWAKSDFRGATCGAGCGSSDASAYQALLILANAYIDLGTYHGVTPYVGAGIGGAYVQWDDLRNTAGGVTTVHGGANSWRFAWALMAGASYCMTDRLELDAGYRYTNIEGGRMWQFANGVGPGFEDGIRVHEARAGLRWHLGNGVNRCSPPVKVVDYGPPPVYK